MNIKQQNLIEAIESHADIINFGSTSDAVDNHWVTKAEDYLGVKLPESYLWFLKNYSGGEIAGEEIYSIYGMEFENINGGDIVFQHIINKRNNLVEEMRIVVNETDIGEVFFFNYEEFDGIEAPIYINIPSGDIKPYADDFYEFLMMRINLQNQL